ncbi:hypothetical protein HDE_04143 [Halotydeus destructor]|nr:hypothetical protein HDE_04143 [Halotydeus destructor]
MKPPKDKMDTEDILKVDTPRRPKMADANLTHGSSDARKTGQFTSRFHKLGLQVSRQAFDGDDWSKGHHFELVHFIYWEIRKSQEKPTALSELRKLVEILHPKLVAFLDIFDLSLKWKRKVNDIDSSRMPPYMVRERILQIKLVAFLLNYRDVFTVDTVKREVRLAENVLERLDEFSDKLAAGFKRCVVMLARSLVAEHNGGFTVSQLRHEIGETFSYLAHQAIPRMTTLLSLITKHSKIFLIIENKVYMVPHLKRPQVFKELASNSFEPSFSASNHRRISVTSFVNLAPHGDEIKAKTEAEPNLELEYSQVDGYGHGHHCICDQDVDKVLSHVSAHLFEKFASRHFRCLISSLKKKYAVKKEFKAKANSYCQTETTISPRLLL